MPEPLDPELPDADDVWLGLEAAVLARVTAWGERIREARTAPHWQGPSSLLEGIRADADAFDFVRDIFDYVALPKDAFVAALGLRDLSLNPPEGLPGRLKIALRVGGIASLGLPWGVVPLVKHRFRAHLADILIAAPLPELVQHTGQPPRVRGAKALRAIMTPSGSPETLDTLNDVELLGAAVLGSAGVEREVARVCALAATDGITRVTIDPARLTPHLSEWSVDEYLASGLDPLRHVLRACRDHQVTPVFAARSYLLARSLPDMLMRVLDESEFTELVAGLEVLATLPESVALLERVLAWARARSERGHARIEVRVLQGSIAPAETVSAIERGLAVPTLEQPVEVDAQLIRLVDAAVRSENEDACQLTIASEDPLMIAVALEIAARRDCGEMLAVHVRRGVARELESVLAQAGVNVQVHTPIVKPAEFGQVFGAVLPILADVLDEHSAYASLRAFVADPEDTGGEHADVRREREARCAQALTAARDEPPAPTHRLQDRRREWDPTERDSALFYRSPDDDPRFDTGGLTAAVLGLARAQTGEIRLEPVTLPQRIPVVSASGFACEPDTDAARPENREWMRAVLARAHGSDIGADRVAAAAVASPETIVAETRALAEQWTVRSHQERATRVRRAALAMVAARDRFVTVLAGERGTPVAEIDHEIGVAVDAARYLAARAEGVRSVRGAVFEPEHLALIVADAYTPLGELAEALTAVLAAGSGAVLAVHASLSRTAAVLIEEWEAAGVPAGVIGLAVAETGTGEADAAACDATADFVALSVRLARAPEFDRVLVFADDAVIDGVRRVRPSLPRDARPRAHGTVLVTPSESGEQAVRAVAASAFLQAGTHPRAARALILLGMTTKPRGFLTELADAVRALPVGDTGGSDSRDPLAIEIGPLPAPPDDAGIRALTELEPGEEWLVRPEQLDDEGRLWRPGIKLWVRPTSRFWADALHVPVIGVMRAFSLTEAIDLQHRIPSGTVAALFSLDADEIGSWIEQTRAASLAVGKATHGRIERQPSGVWRPGAEQRSLTGGPNRLFTMGTWKLRVGTQSETLHLRGLEPIVQTLIEASQASLDYERFDVVRRAALGDALAWRTSFRAPADVTGLGIERNLLRYQPVAVHIRFSENAELADLVRVLAAAHVTGAPITVSSGVLLPQTVRELLTRESIPVALERDDDWLERAAVQGPAVSGDGESPAARIRLIGSDGVRVSEWLSAWPVDVWAAPVTMAGPVELLGFLREQSLSVNLTRYGLVAPVAGLSEWLEQR